MKTVAVFPYGERGHPVRASLDIEGIVRAAKEAHAHAIYPGHGFLSENAGLARRHQKVVELAPAPNLDPTSATGSVRTPSASPGTSATPTPGRSSSCSVRTAATSSSR